MPLVVFSVILNHPKLDKLLEDSKQRDPSRFLVTEEVGRTFIRLADSLAKGIIHAAEQNLKDAAKVGVALAATGAAAHLAIDYTNSESEDYPVSYG